MQINLRDADINDCERLFHWANDILVRGSSFNKKKINWIEHQSWYNDYLRKDDSWIYIASLECGNLIGQIRFDLVNNNSAEIDISIDPSIRGIGLGPELIKTAVNKLFVDEGIKVFIARVKESNLASIKSFLKAGFYEHSVELKNGGSYICFIFDRFSKEV